MVTLEKYNKNSKFVTRSLLSGTSWADALQRTLWT